MLKDTFTKIFQKEKFAVPGMILLLVLLAYGLLALWLGLYWDDWPYIWLLHFFGPLEFIEASLPYRPFLGPIYVATTFLFGEHPFTWQVVGLGTRFLLSLEVWYVLRLIWPSQKWNLMWVVFLFTVYPGYQQQWVSFTHVNQELVPLLWLIASFGATIYALRNDRSRKRLTILALVLQALGLFSTEYFFGLESLRLFFILVVLAETLTDRKELLRKAGSYWAPYIGVWVINAVWTYVYHNLPIYHSYEINLLSSASLSPLAIANEIITTFTLAGFSSWVDTFQILSKIDGTLTQTVSLIVLLLSTSALLIFMRSTHKGSADNDGNRSDTWGLQVMLIGLVGIFAGRLPSWAAGLPLKLEFDYDRFMVSIMLGASMFIVGLATLILKDGNRKIFILSLLVGLSAAHQFSLSNTFRRDWDNQRAFFWQLVWRMPALQEDTVLLTHELPLTYVSDMQVTAPLNWIYASALSNHELPYLLLYVKSRLHSPTLPSLRPETPIQVQYRTARFNGSTSNSVVIYKDADSCLRVLDPVYGNRETIPGVSYFLLDSIPLSNPDRIDVNAPQPVLDQTFFGPEPVHDWCYFYEKAEIARQGSDWEQVVKLYREAQKNGFSASVPVENLPFIEGMAIVGQTDEALKLTDRTLKTQPDLCPAINTMWDRVLQTSLTQEFNVSEINDRINQNGCKR
jgi:hypothetical protein